MARLACVVAAGVPHHVTQRGNRRQQMFFTNDDYRLYRDLMAEWCGRSGVELWAYCLMHNHVHLIATPETAEGLRRGIGDDAFVDHLETILGRPLRRRKPGPKPRTERTES